MNLSIHAVKIICGIILSSFCFSATAIKCDVDNDTDIDRVDISTIFQARGQAATDLNDPRDADSNMVINILDGRLCQRVCTLPRCAEPEPEEKLSDYKVNILINSANPDALDASELVDLNFIGPNLVNEDVEIVSKLQLSGPIKVATLYLKDTPVAGQDLKVLAKSSGFIDTGTSVILSPEQKNYLIDLKLVEDKEGEVAPGVLVSRFSITDNVEDGKVITPIEVSNNPEFGAPQVRVSIPAGVEMTDDDGNPINGTSLKVISFDPYHPEALAAYPGGLDVIADATGFSINGIPQTGEREINFKSAGFIAINVEDDAGNKVKNFSHDIEIAMQFKLGTQDADGNFVRIGDKVPIWSYDEDTGKWSYEKEGVVHDVTFFDGMLDLVFPINHLTYFNLDWHFGTKCTSAEFLLYDLDGVPLEASQLTELDFLLTINSPPAISRWMHPGRIAVNKFHFINAPRGFAGSLKVYDRTHVWELGKVEFTDICASHQASYDIKINVENSLSYEEAMELIAQLLSQPLSVKQGGISVIEPQVRRFIEVAVSLSAKGDEKGEDLVLAISELIHAYAEAFLDNVGEVYAQRLTSEPFILTDPGSGFNGYGCLHPDVADYISEALENYATYVRYSGEKEYPIGDLVTYFTERAAEEFIAFSPDQLAYTAEGVSRFVSCGFEISTILITYDSSSTLETDIYDHFEGVVLQNVARMRADVDLELNSTINLGSDLPKPIGMITYSTAATFDFILQDALKVANDLAAIDWFSTIGIDKINEQIAFLQQLRDDGKVLGAPPG